MKAFKRKDHYLIILEKGERVMETLEDFCYKKKIHGGVITGIGGVHKSVLAFFDPAEKCYKRKQFPAPMELVLLTGNITKVDNGIKVHCHAVLGLSDFRTVGGHLIESEVNITAEIAVYPAKATFRSLDQATGLQLVSHG
ncbi:MAG: DUF296 domain-containing protein [Nanoarchaeota archaeon]